MLLAPEIQQLKMILVIITIPFAVADGQYKILGTPFFEENIQNRIIQDFTLQFKHQSTVYPNYTKVTSLLFKDYPYFSHIHRIVS